MIKTKVCIIGAGPAGCSSALQLNQLGIDCVVIDKAIFPRDKICGDGLSGKVITCLNRIDPEIVKRLEIIDIIKLNSWGVTFVAPNRKNLEVGYRPDYDKNSTTQKSKPIGYVSKRMDFDNFLVEEIKRCPHVNCIEGVNINSYVLESDGYLISDDNDFKLKADILIVANGAHSTFSKKVANIVMEPKHNAAGVRAYYKNVTGMHADNFIELHFIKSILPGYFWIFPLPNGEANIGIGMLSEAISKKKVNLIKELKKIIETDPIIKERFKEATLISSYEGYGLPLGSKKRLLSGERYMLVGDAASLIDPFTGEGIGNALYSGRYAANQAAAAIVANDFSKEALYKYDLDVERGLGTELRLSHQIQKLIRFPWLFNLLVNISNNNKQVKELISCMFYEVDIRKRLTKPSFYFKLLFNR
jgi:geranylgeranyl reductase family protein